MGQKAVFCTMSTVGIEPLGLFNFLKHSVVAAFWGAKRTPIWAVGR